MIGDSLAEVGFSVQLSHLNVRDVLRRQMIRIKGEYIR